MAFAQRTLRSVASFGSRNPIATSAVAGALCGGTGDFVCQFVIQKKDWQQLDWRRTFALSSFGMWYSGPVNMMMYQLYARNLTPLFKSHSVGAGSSQHVCFLHICGNSSCYVFQWQKPASM
jgi:hypothetical protein